jgi:poly(A) polymerase
VVSKIDIGDDAALARVWDVLPQARLVGGVVRDRLVGLPTADIDLAVPLAPGGVMRRLQAAGVKTVPTGLAHGTVTAVVEGVAFEITSLRRDVVTDGRHAQVAFIEEGSEEAWAFDAARRDFTINAMSATRDGTVFDYFGGQEDLAAGLVRFVGDADARIVEDYLRVLRFFRFLARFGRGVPDGPALAAIRAERDGVRGLSVERVWAEIKRILHAPAPFGAVALMQETGVLGLVMPGASVARLAALLAAGAPADPLLRVAALNGEEVGRFARRMKVSGGEYERLAALVQPNRLTPQADAADIRRALADEAADVLALRTWLQGGADEGWDGLRCRIEAAESPVFPLQGRDLVAAGMAPGAAMGEMLAAVRAWWWDGGCIADRAACLEHVGLKLGEP